MNPWSDKRACQGVCVLSSEEVCGWRTTESANGTWPVALACYRTEVLQVSGPVRGVFPSAAMQMGETTISDNFRRHWRLIALHWVELPAPLTCCLGGEWTT